MLSRRLLLGYGLTLGASSLVEARASDAQPHQQELTLHELVLEPPGRQGHPRARALVLVPAHGPRGTHPALVLLHGRGEAGDEQIGIHAWRTRYGLEDSYSRLLHAPLRLTRQQTQYMRPEQLRATNESLARHPFQGLILICPVTPNPGSGWAAQRALDGYADWIESELIPAAREVAPLGDSPIFGLDGCSMGGFVAAEVFVRKPHLFRTFGVVQPAIGEFRVAGYARALSIARTQHGLTGIHLLTSTGDPYRAVTEALGRELERLDARPRLEVLPGPHDQKWLRSSGTASMLCWQHQQLTSAL